MLNKTFQEDRHSRTCKCMVCLESTGRLFWVFFLELFDKGHSRLIKLQ